MQQQRRYVISIAGFDPSAGAGILADIKTFEHLEVYGLGVCSAITIQTEDQLQSVRWISCEEIISQLKLLLEKYPVQFLKIGIVESLEMLKKILTYLEVHFPQIKIIWDPVMKASSGFEFHSTISKSVLTQCCQKVFLLTPNAEEALALTNETDAVLAAEQLQQVTQVFMKSFKMKDGSMYDVLLQQGTRLNFKSEVLDGFEKHGSGCVLSAAITAFLALGNDLKTSCELAKSYTFEFLQSAPGLLGTHHAIKLPVQHG